MNHMKRIFDKSTTGHPRRCGFTLVEVMISISISSMVIVAVMGLQYISGKTIKTTYAEARTRSSRMMALDQIRYRLCEARIGSTVLTQPNAEGTGYHRIAFVNPNLGGVSSAYFFTTGSETLFYDANVADATAAEAVVTGPIDISFVQQNGGAIIQITVKSSGQIANGDVDLQDGETVVYLRNT